MSFDDIPSTQPTAEGHAGHEISPLLSRHGFRHAFFHRQGGLSLEPYSSLNFSYAVGDDSKAVADNFSRAAAVIGVPADKLYFLEQVHERKGVKLNGSEDHRATMFIQGDALLAEANSRDFACCVRVADCVPILLANRDNGAVAAIHSGWRGTAMNIAGALCAQLSDYGPGPLIACIGPHISATAFEISEEVAAELRPLAPAAKVIHEIPGARPHADLRIIIRTQLEAAGLDPADIDDLDGGTVGDPERYFSFRRDGKRSGRHLAAIAPRQSKDPSSAS